MLDILRSIYRDKKLLGLLGFAMTILLVGVLFYSNVEHWSALNALYFSVITLTTVGYGDLTPQTNLGKMFTIIYIFIGLGVILGLVSIIARHATDKYSQLTEAYFEKTEKDINSAIKKALRNN
jgi:voltage-gated potassium channel Kch